MERTTGGHSTYELPSFLTSGATTPFFREAILLFLMSGIAFSSDETPNPIKKAKLTYTISVSTATT